MGRKVRLKIEILNYVWSKISHLDIDTLYPCLRYKKTRKIQGNFAMETIIEEASFLDKRNGKFLTGFLPRIREYCRTNSIFIEIQEAERLPQAESARLPTIVFRPDQENLLQRASAPQRGVIKSPTGTGKTIVAAGLCSMWPKSNILFLCHTIDLLMQSRDTFVKVYGFKNVIMLGAGSKAEISWNSTERTIVVSTRQSWDKIAYEQHKNFFDIIIIDECHHVGKKGQYTRFLEQSLAIGRFGLTATLPELEQDKMNLEGYIGPVIGEFSITEAITQGILAKPLVNLVSVPYSDIIGTTYTRYGDLYQFGIVESRVRNRLVLTEAMQTISTGGSVLILVSSKTEHGRILSEMAKDVFDLDAPFVYGQTKKKDRLETKNLLEDKEVKCVIANKIWFEGINIKSVDHIINAAGGKSAVAAEQIPGRGLRTTETKKTVRYTDFLDPYKYLDHHTIMRLIVYANLGWLKWEGEF